MTLDEAIKRVSEYYREDDPFEFDHAMMVVIHVAKNSLTEHERQNDQYPEFQNRKDRYDNCGCEVCREGWRS